MVDTLAESMSSMMITNGSISDFGIGMLLNQSGIFLIGIAGFSLIHIFFKIQKIVKTSLENLKIISPCLSRPINSLIALGWGLSLIHYTPAVELGGRELFAFHIAICLLSIRNMKKDLYQAS